MSNFRDVDRQTGFLLPPSVDEWLPQRHLTRFVVEVIDRLDLRALVGSYRGSGSASYHPSMLLGLLVYGCASGVFASRKLERATYDSVAFRFIAANDHPDHDTIATPELVEGSAVVFEGDHGTVRQGVDVWRVRWGCCNWARWRWTAPRSTPMRAGTVRFLTSMQASWKRS
jgi:hypothetical protein